MQTLDRDEHTTTIAASPDLLWSIVSDVTRTPELSPEITHCTWLDGATGPAVGARFEATNTTNGRSWKNRPVVTAADPGRDFAFERTEPFAGTVAWRYTFTPVDGGTRVHESYEVTRPITRLGWLIIERIFGGRDRRSDLRRGMRETHERLAALATREPSENSA